MSKVVVIYHSGYGHTQRMAQSVAKGADAELLEISAEGNLPEGGWETLAAADAIVMDRPPTWAALAGSSKNLPTHRPSPGFQ